MVSYNGFDAKYITMQCLHTIPEKISVGDMVSVNNYGDVIPTKDNTAFLGVVTAINDGYYTVQVGGYVELKASGDDLPMFSRLVINQNKAIMHSTTVDAPFRRVLWYDKNVRRAGIIL
ncbi:MAG: hypothetical protein Q4C99_02870 [Clostridia bacterium]|nr:hypothetical protein [Clostridia bacterium]